MLESHIETIGILVVLVIVAIALIAIISTGVRGTESMVLSVHGNVAAELFGSSVKLFWP